MRLHTLEITAFGPFPDTEQIDFEPLNEAGLFLLSGATGAGKTSILDAVCFALYGQVPGARGVKTLKSQHADELARPEVVLDFSVRERRFVLRRSPEWTRPKRRGIGLRTEPAAASLSEVVDGETRFLTSRAAEVGLQVTSLIGMQATQFQQVAMLPQGEFHRFLQASTTERHAVLQQLFQTDRFARIEDWVAEHSRGLRDRSVLGQQTVLRVLEAAADQSGTGLPETWAGPCELEVAVSAGEVASWLDEVVAAASAAASASLGQTKQSQASLVRTRSRLDAERLDDRRHDRLDSARAEQSVLAGRQSEVDAARGGVAAHAQAHAVLPILGLLHRAEEARVATGTAAERARAALESRTPPAGLVSADGPDLLDLLDPVRTEIRALHRLLDSVGVLVPQLEAARSGRAVADLEDRVETMTAERERLASTLARRPAECAELDRMISDTRVVAGREESLDLQVERARERLAAATRLPEISAAHAAAQDAVRTARDRSGDAREHVLRLTERRLLQMAAELAGELQEEQACQVCGSLEHPLPAQAEGALVSDQEQRDAESAYDDLQRVLVTLSEEATTLGHAVTSHSARADGRSTEQATAELGVLTEQAVEAREAQAALPRLEQRLTRLHADQSAESAALGRLTAELTVTESDLVDQRVAEAEIATLVEELLGADWDPDALDTAVHELEHAVALREDVLSTSEEADAASDRCRELVEQAQTTARTHGFDGLDAVRAAVLTDSERVRLEVLVAEHAEARIRVEAVLRDPEVLAILGQPRPDLSTTERRCQEEETALSRASRRQHADELVRDGLDRLQRRWTEAEAEWAPVRREAHRTEAMSKLVRGMGSDNQLQMRLSAYVLAQRLDQVLAAANERLQDMRDQRYLLQRTGRAARRSSQAGLGLEVVDQWTGDVRDPVTLSGGETFVVSLALALGLADVVSQEAGGVQIETLFVDEGFGSLDADTLDDVMDRLDALRAGGRTVGVVSHVSELRARIPHQLHVDKSPGGSTVRALTAVG